MKRIRIIAIGLLAVSLLTVGAATSVANSLHGTRSGPVTIQSWLSATPGSTGLAGTVTACFKLDGAFRDQGGKPTWTDTTYDATSDLDEKCGDWTPVGGFNFVPPVSGQDSTLYAVHTITGARGQIFITFAGSYNLVTTYQGVGTWVVTGGTGAYQGIRGEGTWSADATTFPKIRHTEVGTLTLPR